MAYGNFETMSSSLKLQFKMMLDFATTPYGRLQWRTRQGQKRPSQKDLWELTHSTRLEF